MDEQEMQFADPDWRPTGSLPMPRDEMSVDIAAPLPVNDAASSSSGASTAYYAQGYRHRLQQERPVSPRLAEHRLDRPTSATRGHPRWPIWVVLFLFLASLAGGMLRGMLHSPFEGGSIKQSFEQGQPFEPYIPAQPQSYSYNLGNVSQVAINNPSGSLMVQAADLDSDSIIIQTDSGSAAAVKFAINDGMLSVGLTSSAGSNGDVTILLPRRLQLDLRTSAGNIEVDGYRGQVSARADSGSITLNDDILNGQSLLSSNSGTINLEQGVINDAATVNAASNSIMLDREVLSGQVAISAGGNGNIGLNGLLDPRGDYRFTTVSGNINLTLPAYSSVHVQRVSPGSGSYHNDFFNPSGPVPQASLTLKTGSGHISIYRP